MLDEVQRAFEASATRVSSAAPRSTARVTPEQAIELITELVEKARGLEDPAVDPMIVTALHAPAELELGEKRGAELGGEPRRAASACRTSTVSATAMSSRYSSRVSNDSSTLLDRDV